MSEVSERPALRLLHVEDREDDALLVAHALRKAYAPRTHRVETAEALREALAREAWDIVLADYALPRFSALDAIAVVAEHAPDLPVIVVSGAIGEERAVAAMRAGAADYVMKDNLARLAPAIARELELAAVRRERAAAREYLAAVLDHVDEGLVTVDPARRVRTANRAAARLFGGPPVGRALDALFDFGDALPTSGRHEVDGIRDDGSRFDAALTLSAMSAEDGPHLIAVVSDVTERKQLARRLLEQESLARLGEMAAIVAHEVKNPLAAIRGAVKVLGGRVGEGDDAIVPEIVERIDGLAQVVNDLLLFARPTPPRPRPADLRRTAEEVVRLLAGDPLLAGVEVTVEPRELVARFDPAQLKPVLQNLLLNAAQAMDGRGAIAIALTEAPGRARLTLTDDGPGIAPELRTRVFEPFFTTRHRGSGLGLPLARRIVRAHGGELTLVHPDSGGTRVVVELPR